MRFALHLLALSILLPPGTAAAAPARPNVIMILIDDMGWGDLSCFGNTQAKTPNIDRLAAEGIRFSQFYVNSPICSPSRVALTTGQYPQRWRITSFLNNRADNDRRGIAQWLDPKAPTLARALQQHGYATGHFGKWHMGGQRDVGEAPLISEYGFDESLTNFEGLGPRLLPLCDDGTGELRRHALGSDNLGRGPIIWQDRARITSGFTGAAIAFLKKASTDGKPFFFNLWPDDVHSPFFPPLAKRGDGGKRALYHAVLESMDQQLGVLFDAIRADAKLRDNTLILFCSDNGHEPGAGSAGPHRGAKASLYEGGIRSPLIVWGPGLIPAEKAGFHNETSVLAAIDLPVSVLAITGAKTPEGAKLDGGNLRDVILGASTGSRAAPLFWRRPPAGKKAPADSPRLFPDLATREGNWKLVCAYDGTRPELYDMANDRGEANNLAEQNPEIVKRLTESVLAWNRSMPQDNGPNLAGSANPKRGARAAAR
jgi:arylsulfatase A-like enzyme